jgi:hypothetical protein
MRQHTSGLTLSVVSGAASFRTLVGLAMLRTVQMLNISSIAGRDTILPDSRRGEPTGVASWSSRPEQRWVVNSPKTGTRGSTGILEIPHAE